MPNWCSNDLTVTGPKEEIERWVEERGSKRVERERLYVDIPTGIDDNEIIITPHVTSPYITLETMLKASEMLVEYDTVCACTEHKEFTYFKGQPVNFNPEEVPKTQDLESVIMGNGAFFIFTKKEFMKNKNRTSENNYFNTEFGF